MVFRGTRSCRYFLSFGCAPLRSNETRETRISDKGVWYMGRDVNIKYSIANVIYRAALPLKLFRSFFPSPFKFQFITIFIILLDHQVPWNFYLQQQDNIEIHLKINRFSKYHFFPFHLFHFPFHTKQVYPLVQLYLSSPPRLRLVSTQDASPLPFNTDTSFTVAISTGCFQFTLDVAKLWWSFIDSSQMPESISIDRIFDAICGKARLCNSINHPPRMIIAEGVDASRTMKPSISSLLSIR